MIMKSSPLAVGCVLALTLLVAPDLRAQSFAAERAPLVTEPIPKLEELAVWCGKNGLARERDRSYGRILILDPQHAAARKALQFTREANGTWRQSTSYKEATNQNPKNLPQFVEKSREATATYAASVLALLEKFKEPMAPKEREQELRNLLSVAPDDQRVQDAVGEAKVGDKWVLRETVTAAERTKQLAAAVTACLASAKVVDARPEPEDEALGMTKSVAKTDRVRVAGLIVAAEARRIAQLVHTEFALLDAVFGDCKTGQQKIVIYEVTSPTEAAALMARPVVSVPDWEAKNFIENYGGIWLSRTSYDILAIPGNDGASRLETTIRSMVAGALGDRYTLPGSNDAFSEALSTHLAWLVAHSRRVQGTTGVPLSPVERALEQRLLDPKSDWMSEARKLVATLPPLKTVLSATVLTARPAGQLYAYAFANYVLLGRPTEVGALLAAFGPTTTVEAAVTKVLKMDIDAVDARVRRWLSETQ